MLKGSTPLVMAAILAILAGILAYTSIASHRKSIEGEWELDRVLVANAAISEGTVLTNDLIADRAVPVQLITSSNIRFKDAGHIRNQPILVNVQRGEPLLWSQFSMSRTVEQLSTKVSLNARAFTVKVDSVSSVGGWIRPNDKVDVIWIYKDSQTQESVATTLMQNVMVLATGNITGTTNVMLMSENDRKYSEVSLMVLPEAAEQLALAQELGTLTLSLRGTEDAVLSSENRRTTLRTLINAEAQKVLRDKQGTIEVIRSVGSR